MGTPQIVLYILNLDFKDISSTDKSTLSTHMLTIDLYGRTTKESSVYKFDSATFTIDARISIKNWCNEIAIDKLYKMVRDWANSRGLKLPVNYGEFSDLENKAYEVKQLSLSI